MQRASPIVSTFAVSGIAKGLSFDRDSELAESEPHRIECADALPTWKASMTFVRGASPMTKLVLLVALAFSITSGSITLLLLNPQPAMACPGNNGR